MNKYPQNDDSTIVDFPTGKLGTPFLKDASVNNGRGENSSSQIELNEAGRNSFSLSGLNEFNIDQAISKAELTNTFCDFLQKKSLTSDDLHKLISKGAHRCGFQFVKPITITKFVDLLLPEFEIADSWMKDEKRMKRRHILKRAIKSVYFLQKLYVSSRKHKRARSTAILSTKQIEEISKYKRPEYLRKSMRNYTIFYISLCSVVFAGGWLFQRFVSPKNYAYIGVGIGVAKGSAFALLVTTILCLLLMHRDFLSFLRRTSFGILYELLLNEHVYFHKVCGATAFFFGITHTLGHLFGTYWVFSTEKNVERINAIMLNNRFDRILTYSELLFETIPGLTGVFLIIIMLFMWITSTQFYRRYHYQVFSYTHLLYIPFLILYYIHGCGFWFNYGWPLSTPLLSVPFLISLYLHVKKWMQKKLRTDIVDVSFSAKNTVAFIKIRKPEGFDIIPGHYVFLNCPELSLFEWHPFSVCSTGRDGTLKLMVKKAGDFTKLFLALLFTAKSEHILAKRPELTDHGFYQKLYYEFNLKEEELIETLLNDKVLRLNVPRYPKISLYGPISGPAMGALHQKNVIFIGAGVGLTPYLVFLEEYIHLLKTKKLMRRTNEQDNREVLLKKKIQELVGDQEYMRKISVTPAVLRTNAEKKYYKNENNQVDEEVNKPMGLVEEFFKNFEKISFYFVARNSDQLSWLSSYIKRLIKYDYSVSKLDLRLFLTAPKDFRSPDSFLFWRAFNKYNKTAKKAFSTGDVLTNLPMQIIFGRPDFVQLFESRIEEAKSKTIAVFACAPEQMIKSVDEACNLMNKKEGANFIFHPEQFN